MRRRAATVCAVVFVAALASCAVPERVDDDAPISKVAATEQEVEQVYEKYRQVRNAAVKLLDPKPLSTVETGPVLGIDTGSFEVSQRLNRSGQQDTRPIDVQQVGAPRFSKYPLWFFAVVNERGRKVQRLQIFERATPVDPWLLVASPEALSSTSLPTLRTDRTGAVQTVGPKDARGLSMSVQQVAEAYARVAKDSRAKEASQITDDGFLRLMRKTRAANAGLSGVKFSQKWKAEPVEHVLRTADGGALAFMTLLRTDTYAVAANRKVTWPAGSAQKALLEDGITGSQGSLNYYHQIAVLIPAGTSKPRTIAQFGGVVYGGLDAPTKR